MPTEVKKVVVFVVTYFTGLFWATIAVFIPLLKDILIKGKDVFIIKDRSSYLTKLSESSDFGKHNTITLEGKTFHYVEVGDTSKPLILFLHGFPQFWYTWRYQLQGLRSMDYHLVAVDMRGAGESYKPRDVSHYEVNLLLADIRGIIQKLSPNGRAACLVGHDWGALIAWQVAAQSWEYDQYKDQSGYIDRLIIINCPHALILFQNIHERLSGVFNYRNLKSLINNPTSTITLSWEKIQPCINQFLKSYYVFIFKLSFGIGETWFLKNDADILGKLLERVPRETMSEEDVNIYKATFSSDNHACLTGGMNYYRSNAINGFFREQKRRGIQQPGFIGIPTLVIWGDQDVALNKDMCLSNLEKLVSNLKIVHLPETNHFVQEEVPDKVNDLIRKFITNQGNFHDLDENIESST